MIRVSKNTIEKELKFRLVVTDEKELIIYIANEKNEDGLDRWVSIAGNHPKIDVPAPSFINRLMREIQVMVEREEITFFWFNPTDCNRMSLFHMLANRMMKRLGKGWEYSLFEQKWLYFMYLE